MRERKLVSTRKFLKQPLARSAAQWLGVKPRAAVGLQSGDGAEDQRVHLGEESLRSVTRAFAESRAFSFRCRSSDLLHRATSMFHSQWSSYASRRDRSRLGDSQASRRRIGLASVLAR